MNTNDVTQSQNTTEKRNKTQQNIQLVRGEFTMNEASDVILSLLDQKLNFHKAKRFQLWTRNANSNFEAIDKRISELKKEKEIAENFIAVHKDSSTRLKLDAKLEISVMD